MFNKQKRSVIFLAVTALILLGGLVLWQQRSQHTSTVIKNDSYFIPAFSAEQVTAITITQPDSTTILKKSDTDPISWVVSSANDAPAKQEAVSSLLSVMSHGRIQAVASTLASDAGKYGFSDTDQIHVEVKANETMVADFYVGKIGSATSTFYAQRSNDPTIYVVNGQRGLFVQTSWEQLPTTTE